MQVGPLTLDTFQFCATYMSQMKVISFKGELNSLFLSVQVKGRIHSGSKQWDNNGSISCATYILKAFGPTCFIY